MRSETVRAVALQIWVVDGIIRRRPIRVSMVHVHLLFVDCCERQQDFPCGCLSCGSPMGSRGSCFEAPCMNANALLCRCFKNHEMCNYREGVTRADKKVSVSMTCADALIRRRMAMRVLNPSSVDYSRPWPSPDSDLACVTDDEELALGTDPNDPLSRMPVFGTVGLAALLIALGLADLVQVGRTEAR